MRSEEIDGMENRISCNMAKRITSDHPVTPETLTCMLDTEYLQQG